MKSNAAAFAFFLLVAASFSFASQLGMQYATATVFRDCAQKPLSIVNRSEFLQFYDKPVDESNIGKIIALVSDLSSKDSAAQATQQTYLTCGDYLLTALNGTVYWRGVELTAPGYVSELEGRVVALEGQYLQSGTYERAMEDRVFLLEEDMLKMRNDFSFYQNVSFVIMSVILLMLVYSVFFYKKEGAVEEPKRHGIRHHVSKLLHRK